MTTPIPDYPDRYEVTPRGGIQAVVRPPGSKSLTNRALLVAALAEGESVIRGALDSDDTAAMRACLRGLGVEIRGDGEHLIVRASGHLDPVAAPLDTPPSGPVLDTPPSGPVLDTPAPGPVLDTPAPGPVLDVRASGPVLDVRASGTTARFVTAAAATASGPVRIDGTPRMRERPIDDLVAPLRAMGAEIRYEGSEGFPPLTVGGGRLEGGRIEVDASRSSQFVSALLMVAPLADRPVELLLAGPIVSRPYIDNTIEVMTHFGAAARWTSDRSIRVEPSAYRAAAFDVEPDASAAVYAWAAAAITGGTVTVEGLAIDSTQADMGALPILEEMGCSVEGDAAGVTVVGPRRLAGVDVDMNACPDATLGMAVVAAFADGPSTLRNIANLRIKETDRLAALETELRRLGAGAEAGRDWLRIEPAELAGTTILTYDDHRMAMAFAVAGLRIAGVIIDDPACVAKTWPGFFEMLEGL